MYLLAQPLGNSAVSSRATNFGRVCTKMSRQSFYFSYSKHKLITQSTVGFIACASNKNSDESAHLSILARAIQNISAFRRHRHAINGGFYFMCEQPESSDESAHVSSLARTFATPNQNISASGLILAQNDDGPLKWANGPYPIQIHADFQILMGHLNFLWALCKI